MPELSFTTRPKVHHVPDVPFTLDDREYIAHSPKRAAWGAMIAAKAGGPAELFQAVGMFLDACLTPEDRYALERRLRDQDDDLDLDDLIAVVEALTEEWAPYLESEMAELTGNREARRAAVRQPADRQPPRAVKKAAPARKTAARA